MAITDATLSEVGEHSELTLYYSSNGPSFTRSNAALLAIVQALAYGVYARDKARLQGPHPRLQAEIAHRPSGPSPYIGGDDRTGDIPGQARPRRDAQGRGDHGRDHRRAGADRRGRGRRRGDGAGARPGRHPRRRRRRADGEPAGDQGDPGGGDDPGDGQGADRPLRRGAGAAVARGRLHRRVRGPDSGRRGATTSTSTPSRSRSSAAPPTSARRCGGSARARR